MLTDAFCRFLWNGWEGGGPFPPYRVKVTPGVLPGEGEHGGSPLQMWERDDGYYCTIALSRRVLWGERRPTGDAPPGTSLRRWRGRATVPTVSLCQGLAGAIGGGDDAN